MVGCGIDIVLGGNVDFFIDQWLCECGLDLVEMFEEYEVVWYFELFIVEEEVSKEVKEVIEVGGLYVLGIECYELWWIDNQLCGWFGCQGDFGELCFYLLLGDELMCCFNGVVLEILLIRLNLFDDVLIEVKMVIWVIKSVQIQVEQQNFEVCKNVFKYDEVMNQQCKVIYVECWCIFEGENFKDQVLDMVCDVIIVYVDGVIGEGYVEDWDLDVLWMVFKIFYLVGIIVDLLICKDYEFECDDFICEELLEVLFKDVECVYVVWEVEFEEIVGEGVMCQLECNVLFNVIDCKWCEYFYEMDYFKEGIGLCVMVQCDLLVEYQCEGYDMFMVMFDGMKEELVGFLFNVIVEVVFVLLVVLVVEFVEFVEFVVVVVVVVQ